MERLVVTVVGTAAELAASTRAFGSRELVFCTDTQELRRGPGLWSDLKPVHVDMKVRTVSTSNITIASALNAGDTVNGVELAAGDLVLVVGQSTKSQNGIYVTGASPARHASFDAYDEHIGKLVLVTEGAKAGTAYRCISAAGGTINSTDLEFTIVQPNALRGDGMDQLAGMSEAATLTADDLFLIERNGVMMRISPDAIKTYMNAE